MVAMTTLDSDTEGDLKMLVGQFTDNPEAIKSLTDAILPALLEGLSRQNVRLANSNDNFLNSEYQTGNQAGNSGPDHGNGPISGNEAGLISRSGNEASGPGKEANDKVSNGNMWTMPHGGSSIGAPVIL